MTSDLEHFRARVLQDALAEGSRVYWLRRAEAFEAAKPRVGDYLGRATWDDVANQWRRLNAAAEACRARAQVAAMDDNAPEVKAALLEAGEVV